VKSLILNSWIERYFILKILNLYLASRSKTMPPKKHEEPEQSSLTRIAIVNSDRCKPKRCRQECKKSCPVVRMGKLCIEVTPTVK
jgi:hypothetical protein